MNVNAQLVVEQSELENLCRELGDADYLTIDTEFVRERTYWPQLCLVQVARGGSEDEPFLIDPLADLDLAPLFELMRREKITKVFHAAGQDIEIFVKLMGEVPAPIFDTQVAAMVCGYGDQVGYETLVRKVAGASLDKSSRFTDWARRPLSTKQLRYAAADVTHLRVIYEKLAEQLRLSRREAWVASEMEVLTSKDTYVTEPEDAWRRIKTRSNDPEFLGVVRALARWREAEAQARDVPRGRLLKDDAILEVAALKPETRDQLLSTRSLQREGRKAETCDAILSVVAEGRATPVRAEPQRRSGAGGPPKPGAQAAGDLLRVLLKAKADELGVAPRLIAAAADLDRLAQGERDGVAALSGWRREAFGEDALRLLSGEIALSADAKGVKVLTL